MEVRELLPCTECGAMPKSLDDRFCAYCGAELPRTAADPVRPSAKRDARFEIAKRLPAYAAAMEREPDTREVVAGSAFSVVFMLFFAAVALFIGSTACSVTANSPFGGPGPQLFALVPFAMAAFGIAAAVKAGGRAKRVASSPTERRLALVRDERTKVSGGGENSSASTSYFVTLEYENGSREEHRVSPRAAGRVAPGDVGVAYERAGILVDFEQLDA